MNFARDVVDELPADGLALLAIDRSGERRRWTFSELTELEGTIRARFEAFGVGRGDAVVTLIGNRPEWVATMVACFRTGAVAVPCNEQLRASDLRLRFAAAAPKLVVADARLRAELNAATPDRPVLWIDDLGSAKAPEGVAVDLDPEDPALIIFTSGTTGKPKGAVHAQRYLTAQRLQAENWLGARAGDLAWCTAASGWSKSARNVFVAPWLCGAAAVVDDRPFDPDSRLEVVDSEGVDVLCMAPTEYRVIARRASYRPSRWPRELVAAGEALDAATIGVWRELTGAEIRDGYGQTETGALTTNAPGEPVTAGSMGRALPGVSMWIDDGELVVDPQTIPTFFSGYLGERPVDRSAPWRTGDRVAEHDGRLFFETRADDLIISSGYRIGPEEVEGALRSHPDVADAGVVGAPDPERGQVVRAVVTLVAGVSPTDELARALQDHVKAATAPYKYPRIVEFADVLPRTPSGKLQRVLLKDAR